MSALSAPAPRSTSAWIQGPWSDLVLGAGLIYWPIFLLSVPFGPDLSLNGFSLMPFFVIFIANTHLGATLMRVYERREDRHAYKLFAIWVTLALASLSVVGLWVPIVGSAGSVPSGEPTETIGLAASPARSAPA